MNVIQNLLDEIESATSVEPVAFSSKEPITSLPSITYTAYRQSDNAVVETWRFQTRITAESFEEAIDIDEIIAETLTTLGDEEKYGALQIEVNGGGTLEDENTGFIQLLTYYDIQTRS